MRERRVRVPDDVQKIIAELHPETKRKVRAAIDAIAEDPVLGEPLKDELTGFRKIALGSWRIVYRREGRVLVIRAIGRRVTVYSDLIGRLRRSVEERQARYRRTAGSAGSSARGPAPGAARRARAAALDNVRDSPP